MTRRSVRVDCLRCSPTNKIVIYLNIFSGSMFFSFGGCFNKVLVYKKHCKTMLHEWRKTKKLIQPFGMLILGCPYSSHWFLPLWLIELNGLPVSETRKGLPRSLIVPKSQRFVKTQECWTLIWRKKINSLLLHMKPAGWAWASHSAVRALSDPPTWEGACCGGKEGWEL